MKFDYQITDASIGQALPIQNGFLVNLSMTAPPSVYEVPSWDPGAMRWRNAHFVLRGSRDHRDLVCINPHVDAAAMGWYGSTGHLWTNASVGYRGDLTVVCVPKGSVWSLTLSDVPNVKARESFQNAEAKGRSHDIASVRPAPPQEAEAPPRAGRAAPAAIRTEGVAAQTEGEGAMTDARHHRASREIILVPVPFEGGSPKHARDIKPRYPKQQREHWTGPPRRDSKAKALERLLREFQRQDVVVREMLRPDAAGLKAWLSAARFAA